MSVPSKLALSIIELLRWIKLTPHTFSHGIIRCMHSTNTDAIKPTPQIVRQLEETRIAIITCKSDPDYIRASVLRQAVATYKDTRVYIVKNTSRTIFRYFEVLFSVLKLRLTEHPDIYLLTFRGYELIPILQLLVWPKPIIFDEFINLYEWAIEEHHKARSNSIVARMLRVWWSLILKHCRVVLADTQAHADHSATLSGLINDHYISIPVGTDDKLFHPSISTSSHKRFTIFYYGNMLPLHGVDYVIQAAEQLKNRPEIFFQLVGGDPGKMNEKIRQANINGAHIFYRDWIPFADLPKYIHDADICLGGPFGNTVQSQLVITGKSYQFMACGVATIIGASKASGIFTDKRDCIIVEQGNSVQLADAIRWGYEHPKELAHIAQKGRELYEKEFSIDVIAQLLRPAIDRCIIS
jgi:glycosyltransferase involved in cell wall biosynthesis